jgi:signal transduction histidine kinase
LTDTSIHTPFQRKHQLWLLAALSFFLLAMLADRYKRSATSLEHVRDELQQYIQRKQADVNQLWLDSNLLKSAAREPFRDPAFSKMLAQPVYLFGYGPGAQSADQLLFWNNQQSLPYPSLLYEKKNGGFIKAGNGYYVWMRHRLKPYTYIALIPVKWNYYVSNSYLDNQFVFNPKLGSRFNLVSDNRTGLPVTDLNGNRLFHLQEVSFNGIKAGSNLAFVLQLMAIGCLLIYLQLLANWIANRWSAGRGWIFLLLSVTLVRFLTYRFEAPLYLRRFALFDPAIYSTSPVFRSLGDLLINVLLITWLILYARQLWFKQSLSQTKLRSIPIWVRWITGALLLGIPTFALAGLIRSLVADSQISFDVLNFFTLSAYSVIGFAVLCAIGMAYYFWCQFIIEQWRPWIQQRPYFFWLTVALLGLIYLSVRIGKIHGGFDVYILAWLLLFLILLNSRLFDWLKNRLIASRLVFWVFFFSLSITGLLIRENNLKEKNRRIHYAEMLAQKSDPANETLINTLMTEFNVPFISTQFSRFYQSGENYFLKDSLINSNTTGYTNKYDTRIYTYAADERPLYNSDSASFNEINAIWTTQSKPTSTPGLLYFDESYDAYSYICKRNINDFDNRLLGYLFIIATPKKVKLDALSPELFSKGTTNSIEQSATYAYAVYHDGKLVNVHNDFPFPSSIQTKTYRFEQQQFITRNGYDELWYNAGSGSVIAIVRPTQTWLESITLFSYLFGGFLLVAGFVWLLGALIRSRFSWKLLMQQWPASIRYQIHGTVILVSAFSFVIIGFATILFFIKRYDDSNKERLTRTIHIMDKEVRNALKEEPASLDSSVTSGLLNFNLEAVINRLSEIHGVDVNLYDLDGNLRVSSIPLLYNKGMISARMNPVAYQHLQYAKEIQFYQKEYIGKLEFASNYVPVRDEQGNNFAFLNIPYFTSESNLRQEISNFLVTIINLNAFVFLIAGIISLFITNRITASLSLISEKMKRVNLGTQNEVIHWKRNDELGQLVGEYNKMVRQLEDSARKMAISEREGAWREMARQVAHEIKNPLTPMKLSLQYLQKAIDANAPNVQQLTSQVSHTLIEQIEHLNRIAADFSQFAQIGEAKTERIDLNEILRNVLNLFASNEAIQIKTTLLDEPVWVTGDKTHFNRLFSNLILNAIQAIPEERKPVVDIVEEISHRQVQIRINDNGTGIDPAVQEKIFTPNFTTKSSGTGLGLAMCKRIVEQAGGSIWFETIPDAGTTFFVALPVTD